MRRECLISRACHLFKKIIDAQNLELIDVAKAFLDKIDLDSEIKEIYLSDLYKIYMDALPDTQDEEDLIVSGSHDEEEGDPEDKEVREEGTRDLKGSTSLFNQQKVGEDLHQVKRQKMLGDGDKLSDLNDSDLKPLSPSS